MASWGCAVSPTASEEMQQPLGVGLSGISLIALGNIVLQAALVLGSEPERDDKTCARRSQRE